MSQDTVQRLEDNIRKAKEILDLENSLVRLERNADFKKVVTEGYLTKEAVRLVHLKSDPAMQTPERQASIVRDIDAIGGLLSYFRTVSHNAAIAAKAIEADEATRDELASEAL